MARSEEHADAYRAIGRYVVEFSILVAEMRALIERQLAGDDPMLVRLTLARSTAEPIAETYFAICDRIGKPDDEERGVGVRLKNLVIDAIGDRNDFAHGDWHLEFGDPNLLRTKPSRKAAPWVAKIRPVEEIDAMSDALLELRISAVEFGMLCEGSHALCQIKGAARVRDVFRLQNREVLRTGRYAEEWPRD